MEEVIKNTELITNITTNNHNLFMHIVMQKMNLTDNYENMVPLYSLESKRQDIHHVEARPAYKYFVTLHTSSTGRHFHHIKFQIDTAATCNTISESTIQHKFSDAQIIKSPLASRLNQSAKLIFFAKEKRDTTL